MTLTLSLTTIALVLMVALACTGEDTTTAELTSSPLRATQTVEAPGQTSAQQAEPAAGVPTTPTPTATPTFTPTAFSTPFEGASRQIRRKLPSR